MSRGPNFKGHEILPHDLILSLRHAPSCTDSLYKCKLTEFRRKSMQICHLPGSKVPQLQHRQQFRFVFIIREISVAAEDLGVLWRERREIWTEPTAINQPCLNEGIFFWIILKQIRQKYRIKIEVKVNLRILHQYLPSWAPNQFLQHSGHSCSDERKIETIQVKMKLQLVLKLAMLGCMSIAGLPPAVNSRVPIYTPGWREALWE